MGLAAGIFLHVALFDIMGNTDTKNGVKLWLKLGFVCIGVALMATIVHFMH